jgi:hypothetical protein
MSITQPDTEPPSTALEVVETGANTAPVAPIAPSVTAQTLQAKLAYADALSRSDLLPRAYRGKPANVLLAMEYGDLLNIHPITALAQLNIIEGTPTMSAELMRAQVRKEGHRFRILENSDKRAVVEIVTKKDPDKPHVETFTMDDAVTAKLAGKDNWKKWPKAMLLARATSAAVRAACSEVTYGISYTPEELGAMVDEDGTILEVTAIDPTVGYPTAEDIAELHRLTTEVMTEPQLVELREWRDQEGISLKDGSKATDWHRVLDKAISIVDTASTDQESDLGDHRTETTASKHDIDHIRSIVDTLTEDQILSWDGYLVTNSLDLDQPMYPSQAGDLLDFLAALVSDEPSDFDAARPEPEPEPDDLPMSRIERAEFRAAAGALLHPPPEVKPSQRGAWANRQILDAAAKVAGHPVPTVDRITVDQSARILVFLETGEVP